ncbi:MAG: helix-turn-helix domain-containing protein [bacterium]|nr:helix-turn-helix domain-containing protein [bacterium]
MQEEKKTINELLRDFGLDEREASIYLSLLNEGPMLPQHIARSTGINRATLYTLFPGLIKIGIIKEIRQGKRRLLAPVSPEDLFNQYESRYKEIKKNIAELALLYRMQGLKPKIEVFEGTEDIKKIYMDTLSAKGEILVYNRVTKYREDVLNWINSYFVPRRIKNKIFVRAIVNADPAGEEHMASGRVYYRETRFVPWDKFPFRIEAMIYNEKITFFTCEKGGPQVGIIIENKAISQTQRALFDLAWEGAERYATREKN